MRKNSIIALFLLLLFSVGLSSCKSFFGYYYDLEQVRSESEFYKSYDYLFTKDLGKTIIDFVIKDNALNIVEIDVNNEGKKTKYQAKHSSSYAIEELVYEFERLNAYNWITSSNLSLTTYSWCIVSKDFNCNNDNFSSFEFIYKDISYCLCYNIDT